ncbi:MAG: Zn-dependent alcohol dehydrogenase [Actinomycetota bacterium]|nr:Zn-dependent alcohol dehydrogenase [Actinomycetota bacterium]
MELADVQLRALGPLDVRVRLAAAGVCHSDLSLARGSLRQRMPAVLGHEGAGTVVAAGPAVTTVRPGDRVVLLWAPPCRECWYCRAGEPWLCERAMDAADEPYAVADGRPVYPGLGTAAFGEHTVVPARALVALPADIALDTAALLGCAMLTGVGAVTNTAGVRAGDSLLVMGLGGVGMAAVQGARIAGASPVVAVDPEPAKRALAARLGADATFAPDEGLPAAVRELTGGRGVDVAIECVGSAATIRSAWSLTRRGGHTVIVGIGGKDEKVVWNALELFHFGRTISGCVFGSTDPARDLPLLIEHLRSGALDVDALVTRRIGLGEVESALADMTAGRGVRALVVH